MSILTSNRAMDEANRNLTDNMRQLIWKKKFEESAEKLLRENAEEETKQKIHSQSLDVAD